MSLYNLTGQRAGRFDTCPQQKADVTVMVLCRCWELLTYRAYKTLDVLFHVMQVDWGKGRALSHMLKALSLADCDDVIPIYLGDDRTDEDAFKVLKQRGSGFGVLISNKVSQSDTLPAMHAHQPQAPGMHASLLIA